ncbi:MAG: family N-acetyltransferase [Pedosphaera sp.]|nr:family N-acetyltransferase [Pedosphaera sp.]
MAVICAQTDSDIRDCWRVLVQLRPHLAEQDFVPVVRKQFAEGYRLAFIRHEGTVAAVAGFRVLHNLAWGRFCYVDDLITDEQVRSHGLGAELLQWLSDFATAEHCTRLELDSGVQRFDAHRFYLRHRMFISSHHFSRKL